MESSEGLAKYNERQNLKKGPTPEASNNSLSQEVQAPNPTQSEPQRSFLDRLFGKKRQADASVQTITPAPTESPKPDQTPGILTVTAGMPSIESGGTETSTTGPVNPEPDQTPETNVVQFPNQNPVPDNNAERPAA